MIDRASIIIACNISSLHYKYRHDDNSQKVNDTGFCLVVTSSYDQNDLQKTLIGAIVINSQVDMGKNNEKKEQWKEKMREKKREDQ